MIRPIRRRGKVRRQRVELPQPDTTKLRRTVFVYLKDIPSHRDRVIIRAQLTLPEPPLNHSPLVRHTLERTGRLTQLLEHSVQRDDQAGDHQ
jgi:hypothetical protein